MPSPGRTMEMISQSVAGRLRKKKRVDPAVKAARIAAYNARCEALRAKMAGGVNVAAAEIAKAEKDAAEREQKAKRFVEIVLTGPHGAKAKRFVGRGLTGNPLRVAMILRNWTATQGIRVEE